MRLLKIALGIVGLLVVLIVGAAIAIPLIFEPNDFKPQIAELVEEETGRQITIDGDIGLSVFPWLAVDLGETRLANAAGFASEPMAEVETANVRVKLLPLLKKQIQIGKVELSGLTLRLARDATGRTNWQDIIERQEENAAEKGADKQPEKQSEFDISSLSVAGLQLRDSRIYWSDAQAGTDYKVENVNLTTGALVVGEPIDLDLAFTAASGQPAVNGNVELEAELKYDLDKQQYAASGLELKVKAGGAGLPVMVESFTFSGDVNADIAAQQYSASKLKFAAEGSGTEGGDVPLERFSVTGSGEVSADMNRQLLAVSGLKFSGKAEAQQGGSLPLSNFDFDGSGSFNANLADQLLSIAGLKLVANGKGTEAFPLVRFKATMSGDLKASPESQQISSDNIQIDIDGAGQGDLPLRDFTAALNGLLDVDMKGQTLSLNKAKIIAKGVGTKDGPAQKFDATLTGDVSANLAQQLYSVADMKLLANAEGKSLPGEKVDLSLVGLLNANLQQQTVSLDSFLLNVLGLQAKGQLSALQITSAPQISGAISTEVFNPGVLMQKLKIELPPMAGPNVMKAARLQAQIRGDQDNFVLKDMQLVFDETRATGEVIVSNFAKPRFGFNLNVDQLDADRYLPPKTESKPGASKEQQEKDLNQTPVDLTALESLNIEGNARIGKLKINDLDFSNISLGVKAQEGDVLLSPLALDLYGGSLQGNLAVNVKGGKQTISAKQTLQNLEFEPFTRALMDDAKVAGKGDLKLDITTSGNTVGAFRKNLNGTVDVAVDNGAIVGVNIAQFLRSAKAKLTGDSALAASAAETKNTDFAKITASAKIVNGVLSNPDLLGKSPALRLLGEGNVNLFAETLDYKTNITIVETSKGQGGDDLDDLRGFAIPVTIGGTFSNPKIGLDMKAILKAALASKIDLDAEKAKLQAKLDAEKARFREREAEEKAKLQAKLDDEKAKLQAKLKDKLGSSFDTGSGEDGEGESVEDKANKELERGLKKLFGR